MKINYKVNKYINIHSV